MKASRCLLLATIPLIMASCAATGPIYHPVPVAQEKALVYFFREPSFVGSMSACVVSENGNPVAELNTGGYGWSYVAPGKAKISAEFGIYDFEVQLDLDAGETYFIQCGGYMSGAEFVLELKHVENTLGETLILDNVNQNIASAP